VVERAIEREPTITYASDRARRIKFSSPIIYDGRRM
jgi:hypothetical protein